MRQFWEEDMTLTLMRRIQSSVGEPLQHLSYLLKENRLEFLLETEDSTFYKKERFRLIQFQATEAWKMFYTSRRNKLMKHDICALYIFEEEEGTESETRTLAYIWKTERNLCEKEC